MFVKHFIKFLHYSFDISCVNSIFFLFTLVYSVNMKYTIRSFIAEDGERFSQLYAAVVGGFPLFYPTAYVARSVRPNSTNETQKVHLEAIKRVCEWEADQGFDLATRIQRHQYLRPSEIDDLARHLGKRRRGQKGEVIGRGKYNTYVAYAADYLRWLADAVITETSLPEVRAAIEEQHKALSAKVARKRGSVSARNQRIAFMRLPEKTRQALLALFEVPFKGVRRVADKGPRLRNVVMLRILYETGMRRGELLSLKLGSFQESGGGEGAYLQIERNHHDELDSRVRQPVVKTLGRVVPISDEAEAQLADYRDNWRAEVPGVGFSHSDLLFVNHRARRSQGEPITETTFNSALENLKGLFDALEALHPHLLRHDWNYRFSNKADEEGWDFKKEREVRESLMGWVSGSKMSLLYNQRHIQEEANEIAQKIASDTIKKRY